MKLTWALKKECWITSARCFCGVSFQLSYSFFFCDCFQPFVTLFLRLQKETTTKKHSKEHTIVGVWTGILDKLVTFFFFNGMDSRKYTFLLSWIFCFASEAFQRSMGVFLTFWRLVFFFSRPSPPPLQVFRKEKLPVFFKFVPFNKLIWNSLHKKTTRHSPRSINQVSFCETVLLHRAVQSGLFLWIKNTNGIQRILSNLPC